MSHKTHAALASGPGPGSSRDRPGQLPAGRVARGIRHRRRRGRAARAGPLPDAGPRLPGAGLHRPLAVPEAGPAGQGLAPR